MDSMLRSTHASCCGPLLHPCEVGVAAAPGMQNKVMPSVEGCRTSQQPQNLEEEPSSVTPAGEKLPAEALSYSRSCASCCYQKILRLTRFFIDLQSREEIAARHPDISSSLYGQF